jgi:hypothetical protein
MARGWESKAVESQQDDARARKGPGDKKDDVLQGRATDRARTLELARAALAAQLQRAPKGALHDSLQRALADLDRQLAEARREMSH